MKITVAESAGFCKGVENAVNTALALAKKYGKIYTVGALVHNESVTQYLQSNRVYCLEMAQLGALKRGDVALIRAHGIPVALEEELKSRGVVLYDATCPVVKRNQKLAKDRADAGDEVIIVGDCKHDEVIGVASYAGERARVVAPENFGEIGKNNISVLFQTTVLPEIAEKIKEKVKKIQKNRLNSLVVFDTICYTTKARQDQTRTLAALSDAVVVLGSASSANTRRLYEVAKEVNPNALWIHDATELLALNSLSNLHSISIVAGASTPPWLIREVKQLMSETTQNPAVDSENEAIKEATLQEQTDAIAENAQAAASEQVAKDKEPATMAELLKDHKSDGYTNYKVGKRIEGRVISAADNGIFVAIGGKKDGFIDKADAMLDGNYDPAAFKPGDKIQAIIVDNKKEYVVLSKKEVDKILLEEAEAEKALNAGEFSLKMTEVVNGGLRGKLGPYTIFVPRSQIRMGFCNNPEDYKNKTLRLMLMPEKPAKGAEEGAEQAEGEQKPAKKRSHYLVASQRMVLEKEKQAKEDEFWNNIQVHEIVSGKVKRFVQFGAFVSVRGFDCLAHISELSWNKIDDPSKVLTIGETYDFVVLKLDREHGRVSLGYKQLQKKPYEVAAEKFPVGTVIKGRVERIFPYGAFISIDEGVDGLVHVSQISHNWIKDANEALTVGQEVEAKIIGFDENRITLSIKELLPAPDQTVQDAAPEQVDVELTDEERAAKRKSKMKQFEKKVADGGERKPRNSRKNNATPDEGPKEWVSGGSASIGDLFKDLKLDLPSGEAPASDNDDK